MNRAEQAAATAAEKRLYGTPVVGLTADQVRAKVRYGDADPLTEWPRNAAVTSPLAAALIEATRKGN